MAQSAEKETVLKPLTVTSEAIREELSSASPKNPFRTPESSSNHIQVISREEIEQLHPADVFELLNMAGGVVAVPRSSRMGFSSLSIRGDSNFRWMIDGIYLDAGTASRIMSAIPVAAIEEIQVVRGSSALSLGPMTNTENPSGGAAVDGFVVVRTRKPQKAEAQVRLAVESNQGHQESIWLGKTMEGETKGYVAALLANAYTDSPTEKLDNGNDYNVDRESRKIMLKGGIEVAGWNVDLMAYEDEGSYQIANTNSHVAGSLGWYVNPAKTHILSLSGNRSWDARNTTLWSASTVKGEQTVNSPAPNKPNVVNAEHINLRHNLFWDNAKLSLGGDYRHWEVPNGQSPAYYPGVKREEITRGWFVQSELALLDGRLNLDASVREDNVFVANGLNFMFAGNGGGATKTLVNNIQLPSARFSTLGSRYNLDSQWALTARYGRANQPLLPGIKAASGVNLQSDAQTKWELGVDSNLSRAINASFNYFSRLSSNEKQITAYSNASGTCVNLTSTNGNAIATTTPCYSQSDTTRAGVELTVSGELATRSRYRFSWTHFTELSGFVSGADLEGQTPSDVAEIIASHGFDRYTLSGAVKYVASYSGPSNGTIYAPAYAGYTKLDLSVGYDWNWNSTPIRTTLYARNLADKKFETAVGVQDVGRVIGIEMLASF
jgi:iron complex outermembrane receptor protein